MKHTGYLDLTFAPDERFWSALTIDHKCPQCGWQLNGTTEKRALLSGPVDVHCSKCENEWSIAIPLGSCDERTNILGLLADAARFDALRGELCGLIDRLQAYKVSTH